MQPDDQCAEGEAHHHGELLLPVEDGVDEAEGAAGQHTAQGDIVGQPVGHQEDAEDIDAGIAALNNPEILQIITESGDMDRPSDLIRRLLMRPEILALGGKLGMKTLLKLFL